MIDGPQNSLGGTFLQLFLVDNRVVDNDPFFVWFVDGGGGGGGGSGAPTLGR